jgi:iron complex outermembrane receptor protein
VGWDAAAYYWKVRNEILNTNVQPFPGAPFTIPSYRNVERTRHEGLELGADIVLADFAGHGRLSWRTAYTLSRFRFDDDPVFGSNHLPGAPRHLLRSEVRLQRSPGFWVAPGVDWSPSSYFVDSANTATNGAYAVLNVRGGYDWPQLGLYVEAANLTDRRYSASVVVDDALGRYYEPANGRAFYAGLRWRSRTPRE